MKKRESEPGLEEIKTKAVLSAPSGYFDALPDRLCEHVRKNNRQQQVYFPNLKLIGRIAASLLVLSGVVWFLNEGQMNDSRFVVDLSQIRNEDIITYLESYPQFHVEFWDEWEIKISGDVSNNLLPDFDLPLEEIEAWADSTDERG